MTDLLQLTPEYRERVWGGHRLQPNTAQAIGEAWIVYENNKVASGRFADKTLLEVAAELKEDLLGPANVARTGLRFPLLIKLLDCVDWLSVQVHPNDEQAKQLEGPDQFGKTEAWYILETDPGAKLIAGIQPGTAPQTLAQSIRDGSILDHVEYHTVQPGDTVFMPAGTIHALGPGLMLYEVQQTSDITYRVFDWNRPASAGRALHIEQSVAVSTTNAGQIQHLPGLTPNIAQHLLATHYFSLDLLPLEGTSLTLDTRGQSFEAITLIQGQAQIATPDHSVYLNRFESVIVPAATGQYTLNVSSAAQLLRAWVPSASAEPVEA